MISTLLIGSLVLLGLAILGCLYRLLAGPSMADRIAALDTIGINLLAIIAILCMLFHTRAYFDIILLIGVLTFIGTTAMALYIERGGSSLSGEMMRTIGEWTAAVLVLLGALLSILSAFGLVRLPDVYLRSHAATKSATLGVLCILGGVFLYFLVSDGHVSIKILLGIVFVFLTSPVAGHLNGRAAYKTGVPLWRGSVQDDLKGISEQGEPDNGK